MEIHGFEISSRRFQRKINVIEFAGYSILLQTRSRELPVGFAPSLPPLFIVGLTGIWTIHVEQKLHLKNSVLRLNVEEPYKELER